MAADKSDEHQSLAISHKHNQSVVVAFDVEHHSLVGNERSVSVRFPDISWGLPICPPSQGIPSLKGDLGVRVLFPKSLKRCDGYDSHGPIMVPKWDHCKPSKEKRLGSLECLLESFKTMFNLSFGPPTNGAQAQKLMCS